jgi:hypothetical protein
MKEIENRKRKEKKEEKIEKGPQAYLSAHQQIEFAACLKTQSGIPILLSPH